MEKEIYEQKLLEVYRFLYENCSDRDNFQSNSDALLKGIERNLLTEEYIKLWLSYAESVLASYMAVTMYGNRKAVATENTEELFAFFRTIQASDEIKALGIYSVARMLEIEDPMKCYQETMAAFELCPSLSQIFDIEYIYQPKDEATVISKECPYCGAGDARAFYCSPQINKLNKRKDFPPAKLWMKCNCCNSLYTYNFPLMQVGKINGHYVKKENGGVLENRFQLSVYDDIFQRLLAYSNGKEYLEIGIGNGEMLAVALEYGFHVKAVEICREDCERVSEVLGVDIEWCDIVQYKTTQTYDVIVMGDVLEHVTNPKVVLEKVKEMLKPDGILWISTPNYNSAYARMEGFTHCMWHELNHYSYVSRESLQEVLEQLGLQIVGYNISQRYFGSMELCIKPLDTAPSSCYSIQGRYRPSRRQ